MSAPYEPTGFQMIREIEVRNFRCFEKLTIPNCSRINVIVGDSGSGKTALLEAMFLTLAASPEVALRLRQHRGLEGQFHGPPRNIELALWSDFFYRLDTNRTVSIDLIGDGAAARALIMARGQSDVLIPLDASSDTTTAPISFTWRDAAGQSRTAVPEISAEGIKLRSAGESLPEFYYYSASAAIPALENATRFSQLSKFRKERDFVRLITDQYDWIEDVGIELIAGSPVLHATVVGMPEKLPVNVLSGAINRMISLMLGISSSPKSVLLVDEIENGVYFKRHEAFWRGIVNLVRQNDSQIFVTTHSAEWLKAMLAGSGDDLEDISLWRLERDEAGAPTVRQFPAELIREGLEYGDEVR